MAQKKSRSYLVIRLQKDWEYHSAQRMFARPARDQRFSAAGKLPKYTRILPQVPNLVHKKQRSATEDRLARTYQIRPTRGADLEELLTQLDGWPCVEKAWVAAPLSLAAPDK